MVRHRRVHATFLAAGLAVLLPACQEGAVSLHYHDQAPRPAPVRTVHVSHICTRDCHEHFYDGGRVVAVVGHRHGPGCGHEWSGKYWVLSGRVSVSPRPSAAVHVCSRDCHEHYYDGRAVVTIVGHRHGPGCGHAWDGRHWVVVGKVAAPPHKPAPPPGKTVAHVCTRACHDHYYDGRRVITLTGHRHGPGCGHYWDGHHWVTMGKTRLP